ncbi:MAG TPA: hypothetical protein ENK37_11895 [Oceanithermus profundus]|uniref:Sortilin N-terminal domain-containing protein n=1 Tax=Oceanithermus profundus TaxID=187137 RepID=A0A7C4V852_9DEIN|nr:hypothetical protein [Oceanithermus profundus]
MPACSKGLLGLGLALVVLAGCGTNASEDPTATGWAFTNPGGGGAFHAIGAGPTGVLLAGSDLSGAYISKDGGQSWSAIGALRGLGGFWTTHVSAVGFDPQDPDILYLGTEEGLFRSRDGGHRFERVLEEGYITDVRFAHERPEVGYLAWHPEYNAAAGAVFRSEDRGLSWRKVGNLPSGLRILKLLVHPSNPDVVYALSGEDRFTCGEAALFRSEDGGQGWRRVAAEAGQIIDAALDPAEPDALYLSSYGDVWDEGYRCVHDDPDGGFAYRAVREGNRLRLTRLSEDLGPRNLLLWPARDRLRVVDLDEREVWTNAGGSWQRLGGWDDWEWGWTSPDHSFGTSPGGDAKTIAPDPKDPEVLYWTDWQFLYATHDGGRRFAQIVSDEVSPGRFRSRGVDNIVPFELALDADGHHVYAALADLGCFASDDYGESWRSCNQEPYSGSWGRAGGNSLTLAADPERPGVVWIGQAQDIEEDHTLLKSTDFGAHWQPANDGLPGTILSGLTIDPKSPKERRALFVTAGGDVYKSGNDGLSWTRVLACGGCRYTAARGGLVFAGGEAGLWRSADGGGRWERVGPPVFTGEDNPDFWDSGWSGVAAIRFDPHDEERVYVAVFGEERGIYMSDDAGRTWSRVLAGDFLWDVRVDPGDAKVLYAASSSALFSGGYDPGSRGVLMSRDGGAHWETLNEGLAWPFARRLVPDAERGVLWLVSPGLGFARRPLP